MNRLLFILLVVCLLAATTLHEDRSTIAQTGIEQSLALQVRPQIQVAASPSPTKLKVNITRQEYETALATWKAQHIPEYEITLIDSSRMDIGGKMQLRFRLDRGEPRLVEYVSLAQDKPQSISLNTLSADEKVHLRGLSVENMFALIEGLFNEKLAASSEPANDFNIAFDSTSGYPTHVYSRVYPSTGGLSPTECCISYEVLRLNILERFLPGMPKTGNPGD